MDTLQAYLDTYYFTAARLADACSMPLPALAALVDAGLVPQPSHVVTADGTLQSPVFGALPADGATPGEYHHRGHIGWVALARDLQASQGTVRAREALQARFITEFATAVADLDPRERECLATAAWDNFIRGVYGVCVADPSRIDNIARKERLQAALADITGNGTRTDFTPGAAAQLLEMIGAYAVVAMPFAPPEYPHSSRKRLVDDLRATLEPHPCASPA